MVELNQIADDLSCDPRGFWVVGPDRVVLDKFLLDLDVYDDKLPHLYQYCSDHPMSDGCWFRTVTRASPATREFLVSVEPGLKCVVLLPVRP